MKPIYRFLFSFAIVFFVSFSHAFEPLNTDDAGTVKKNTNQIEQYFYAINQVNQDPGLNEDSVTPGQEFIGSGSSKAFPFTYTRGVADNVEMAFGVQYNATPRESYYSPVSSYTLNAKWRFWGEEGDDWNFAIKPILQFPVSKQQQVAGFGQAAYNYGGTLIASHYFNDALEVHINGTYMKSPYNVNYLNGGSTSPMRQNILSASIAPVWNVMDGLRLAIDIGAQTNPPSTEQQSVMYGMLAAIIGLTESLDFGISMLRSASNSGIVINGDGPNTTRLDVGVTWRFE